MEPIVHIRDLTKNYGKSRGVNNVNLEVPEGVVFGFLGPNGAGKTTTISLLVDLLRPTSGIAQIFGLNSQNNSQEIRRRIGFLAGDMTLDGSLSGWQQIEYFGHLRGSFNRDYASELAERLNCNLKAKIKTLSRGNKQKIGLITALMHKPELLILDEPTSGLDPLMQAEFNKLILEHKQSGKTALISSHILSEIQEICDHVAFIRDGRVIASKSMDQLTAELPRHVSLTSDDKKLEQSLKKLPGVVELRQKPKHILQFTYTGSVQPLLSLLNEFQIEDLVIERAELETIFMKYYKG